MIQNRFTRNISANTFQLFINQVFGLAIFYALSKGLDKNTFGQFNWCLAVLLTAFGMLTFGIDQVMVKKIAAGYNRQSIFNAYLFHVIVSGFIFYSVLLLLYLLFPQLLPQRSFLVLIVLGKLAIFLSTPFKQLAAGLENFSALLLMSVTSNIIRGTALLLLLLLYNVSAGNVLITFVGADLLELICCIAVARPLLKKNYAFRRNKRIQLLLLKESLPQTGVVLFTAIMSRFDWILVGLLVSSSKLAEYSFAWKAFEVATLPLLIIAPLMTPLFSRINRMSGNITHVSFFLEWQVIIAAFTALLLNLCWVPVVDFITNGKYGAVNTGTIFLLTLSMPLLYFNNYLWTINFTKGSLKLVFYIMAVSFAVYITACSLLIPLYEKEGAALAYFIMLLVQLILYMQKTSFSISVNRLYVLLLWPLTAFLSGFIAKQYISNTTTGIIIAAAIYLVVVVIAKQFRLKDWKTLQSYYH